MKWFYERWMNSNYIHLWLLFSVVLVVAPHVPYQLFSINVFFAIILLWRFLFELNLVKFPGKWLRVVLTLGAFSLVISSFKTIIGSEAGVSLLTSMTCLKLLEMRQKRELTIVVYLSFFVIITGFLFDQSMLVGIYTIVVMTLLISILVRINQLIENKASHFSAIKYTVLLLVQAIPIMLLLFILFPRLSHPLWGVPNFSSMASTGLSNQMSPGLVSRLADNDSVAFRVNFQGPLPPIEKLYWRGPIFWYFDGNTWRDSSNRGHRYIGNRQLHMKKNGPPIHYQVTLEAHQQQWLFALDIAAKIPLNSFMNRQYQLLNNKPIKNVYRYDMISYIDYQIDRGIKPNYRQYLQLPDSYGERAINLAQEWRLQSRDKPDIVNMGLSYFKDNDFFYTRKPPLATGDPVDEFLFHTQKGFCEHYASSFVFLMRAAGIPARIVTGYHGGELNPVGDYLIVRQSDAHAWAEVWLVDRGWVRIDPTSVIPQSRILDAGTPAASENDVKTRRLGWGWQLWATAYYSWDNISHQWNQWIIGYNSSRQRSFLSLLGIDDVTWEKLIRLLSITLPGVFILLVILLLKKKNKPQDPINRAYKQFCKKLRSLGFDRYQGEGVHDFASRVVISRQDLVAPINQITELYSSLKYAKQPPSRQLTELQQAVRKFKPNHKTPKNL